jgi:hypothetical protein
VIFTGAKDSDSDPSRERWLYEIQTGIENEADGHYLLITYELFKKFEVIARYDIYNRMTNSSTALRKFKSTTVGLSYRLKGFNRIDFNYIMQSVDAPHNSTADSIVNAVGNIAAVQLTVHF